MDFITHLVIPFLVLLALRVDAKKAVLMLPFAVIMDIDIFIPGAHRMLLHNLFVVVVIPLIVLLYLDRYKPGYREYGLIVFFYLGSHLILDLGEGMALFYPLSTDFYHIQGMLTSTHWNSIPLPSIYLDYGITAASEITYIAEGQTAAEIDTQDVSITKLPFSLVLTVLFGAGLYYKRSITFLREMKVLISDLKEQILKR